MHKLVGNRAGAGQVIIENKAALNSATKEAVQTISRAVDVKLDERKKQDKLAYRLEEKIFSNFEEKLPAGIDENRKWS